MLKPGWSVQRTALELAGIFLLWAASVYLSLPYFCRTLSGGHEWLTGHTLVSLRAFEEWGFWKSAGASLLVSRSYELWDSPFREFTKLQGAYLSYPDIWLILPYLFFKILNFGPLHLKLSPCFVESYNLIATRLFTGILIYYVVVQFLDFFARQRLSGFEKRFIALVTLAAWMWSPPVLYWTQNVYLADQAVLGPVYGLTFLAIRCGFDFRARQRAENIMLAGASFLACGSDWYGWIAVFFLLALTGFKIFFQSPRSWRTFLAAYSHSVRFILAGALCAAALYLFQLLYYEDGIRQLTEIGLFRSTLSPSRGHGIMEGKSWFSTFLDILHHWRFYFPLFTYLPDSALRSRFFSPALLSVLMAIPLFLLAPKNRDRVTAVAVYVFIFILPVFQIAVLRGHSFYHSFSALKMALPISLSFIAIPFAAFSAFVCNFFS